MRIAVTGSSGLIGSALLPHLKALGHITIPVVRRTPGNGAIGHNNNGHEEIEWSPAHNRIDPHAFDGVDAVIHLAGAGIADHRWTAKYKRQLISSRTVGTSLIAEAIAEAQDGPRVLLSGSATGYYGARGDEPLDESSAAGTGFLADLVVDWERATARAAASGARVALLRTGIVLSKNGGALKKQLPLFKMGLGGKLGSGRQWLSWISIDDEIAAITHLLSADIYGPVNLSAPNPVTQAEFARTLGSQLHRPTSVPVPKFGPRLVLGRELADNLLFSGQRVLPTVLNGDSAFTFTHPSLEIALSDLL